MKPIRWSDKDKYFGPFTYCASDYKRLNLSLRSGAEEDKGCRLHMQLGRYTLILALPPILKPSRTWVDTSRYEWASAAGGYWDIHPREYGISYSDGLLNLYLGRQTMDSSTEQRWAKFIPWTQWRHVRTSYYDLAGNHFFTEPKGLKFFSPLYEAVQASIDACPSLVFGFKDFDGEQLTAKTKIREMEWRFGTGWFKWLSLFRKRKIRRSLDITFSGETGKRKGSWKGGTIGHGIDLLPGELHEAAFRRYCAEHQMEFLGVEVAKRIHEAETDPDMLSVLKAAMESKSGFVHAERQEDGSLKITEGE